jgi:hypothetical protein
VHTHIFAIHIYEKEERAVEIILEHNVLNGLADNIRKFVVDACKCFSENTFNHTNVTYFQNII